MSIKKLSILFIVLFGWQGCSMPVKKPANPHFHKVTYSKHHLVLRDVRVQTNADGLLIVDIELHNLLGSGAAYQYRVFWKSSNGELLSSADQGWRSVTMSQGASVIKLVAKNNNAKDFRVTIEKRKNKRL